MLAFIRTVFTCPRRLSRDPPMPHATNAELEAPTARRTAREQQSAQPSSPVTEDRASVSTTETSPQVSHSQFLGNLWARTTVRPGDVRDLWTRTEWLDAVPLPESCLRLVTQLQLQRKHRLPFVAELPLRLALKPACLLLWIRDEEEMRQRLERCGVFALAWNLAFHAFKFYPGETSVENLTRVFDFMFEFRDRDFKSLVVDNFAEALVAASSRCESVLVEYLEEALFAASSQCECCGPEMGEAPGATDPVDGLLRECGTAEAKHP